MKELQNIINALPYQYPFLFVDALDAIDENGCQGRYTFNNDLPFYEGHFKDGPVTPGVLLTECCAQIGLVCFGIYLLSKEKTELTNTYRVAMSSSEMEYYKAVMPGETVVVRSEKVYFRFSKLKCNVAMHNATGALVCKGVIAGMILKNSDAE